MQDAQITRVARALYNAVDRAIAAEEKALGDNEPRPICTETLRAARDLAQSVYPGEGQIKVEVTAKWFLWVDHVDDAYDLATIQPAHSKEHNILEYYGEAHDKTAV